MGGDGDRTKVVCVLCVTYVLFGEHRQFFQIHNLATGKVRWGRSVFCAQSGSCAVSTAPGQLDSRSCHAFSWLGN